LSTYPSCATVQPVGLWMMIKNTRVGPQRVKQTKYHPVWRTLQRYDDYIHTHTNIYMRCTRMHILISSLSSLNDNNGQSWKGKWLLWKLKGGWKELTIIPVGSSWKAGADLYFPFLVLILLFFLVLIIIMNGYIVHLWI